MDRLERFYLIDQLLDGGRLVPRQRLLDEISISWSTLKRDLEYMKSRFNAPIEHDREAGGYRLVVRKGAPKYQLPGLWFNDAEAHALITLQHLLSASDLSFLGKHVAPLQKRLNAALGKSKHSPAQIRRRVRLLSIGFRKSNFKYFGAIASAVLRRRRVHIRFFVRDRNEMTERDVSPQRLVHYRDNWYLDAWCHLRNRIQTFSVDAIEKASLLTSRAKDISDAELDSKLASGYGIFSGDETQTAVLRFTEHRSRWVSSETWHPQQKGRREPDGSFVLEFPYNDDRELVGDVLRYGPDVEVIAPSSLRSRVAELHESAAARYRSVA